VLAIFLFSTNIKVVKQNIKEWSTFFAENGKLLDVVFGKLLGRW
jgi:hypothetical protein